MKCSLNFVEQIRFIDDIRNILQMQLTSELVFAGLLTQFSEARICPFILNKNNDYFLP